MKPVDANRWRASSMCERACAGGHQRHPAGIRAPPAPRLPRRGPLMTSAGVKVAISSTSALWDKYSSARLSSDAEDSCSEGAGRETWPDDDTHSLYPSSSPNLTSPTPFAITLSPLRLITPHGCSIDTHVYTCRHTYFNYTYRAHKNLLLFSCVITVQPLNEA